MLATPWAATRGSYAALALGAWPALDPSGSATAAPAVMSGSRAVAASW